MPKKAKCPVVGCGHKCTPNVLHWHVKKAHPLYAGQIMEAYRAGSEWNPPLEKEPVVRDENYQSYGSFLVENEPIGVNFRRLTNGDIPNSILDKLSELWEAERLVDQRKRELAELYEAEAAVLRRGERNAN